MKFLGPTRYTRLNEAAAFVFLIAGMFLALSLASYQPEDPSWNAVSGALRARNLTGFAGAYIADFCYQLVGLAAMALPVLIWMFAWKWLRSKPIDVPGVRLLGAALLLFGGATALSMAVTWRPWSGAFTSGGLIGALLADRLVRLLNPIGTLLATGVTFVAGLYLVSTFSVQRLHAWTSGPRRLLQHIAKRWSAWRQARVRISRARVPAKTAPQVEAAPTPLAGPDDIPIHELEEPVPIVAAVAEPQPLPPARRNKPAPVAVSEHPEYRLPSTDLLNEVPGRSAYDSMELKEIAARIKAKFDEFHVLGNVVQINPGPVVTTFEFKPDAGIKLTRITTLSEDLCLGLQAESILIERIPGKPTMGIEVPNTRREVISLRQILESEEFQNSPSKLTVCLGKDISGRIKVAALESMPHLLIAGSTGAGKSVMLNSLIMSILYKATPDEVRLILIDPKRVEMGIYEGIPHLLTPVITDPKKATNALKNAVLEMERRLKLLASLGVRNIDQFNRKVKQLMETPRSLFEDDEPAEEELKPLPYIMLVIDELADLMMLERANVEEAVTRLAQMARAVGMHLVLATQRPSVDVITGLIKANFPSRISFRVATRVDSRTVLDVMGAEHLLGKGDMLFLPPGSSRLTRVHGAFVTEAETNSVVQFWKEQARPEYDQTFLLAPPTDEDAGDDGEEVSEGAEDPMYQDAVRVVLEMGKASTSTLQRRLRLGYGRAARILDTMQRDGIIGPPDGSKPREVLKRPEWLDEVESGVR